MIPSVAVPVSLIGTFGVMYLLDYSLDNLSLMALTISTGFVVDDAIVVIENITRYLEQGMSPFEAALKGAQEVGFTVLTISVSLVAVFIPLLLMGGIVGRLFREFAVTLSVAIVVSMVVSLTATPMMCAYLLKQQRGARLDVPGQRAGLRLGGGRLREDAVGGASLSFVTLLVLLATIGLNVYLFMRVPKGFFPQQDNGRIQGSIQADQDTSFQAMDRACCQMVDIVAADPAIDTVNGFTGGGDVQHRADVHLAEAARGAQDHGRPDHRAAAAEAGAGAGRDALPAGRAGSARRRPAEQRAVSVHDAGRQSGRSDDLRSAGWSSS